MATLKRTNEGIPESIELTDGTTIYLGFSSHNTSNEPILNFRFGYSKVNQKQLCEHFRAFVPEDIFFKLPDNNGDIMISEQDYNDIKSKFDIYQERQRALELCATLNNKGVSFEKSGEIEKAIEIYELNISDDCYPARHSFDRLLVLYRKSKNYKDEKRVCKKAIKVLKEAKFNERLDKINKLLGE